PERILTRSLLPRSRLWRSRPHKRLRTVLSKDNPCDFSSSSKRPNSSCASVVAFAAGFTSPLNSTNSFPNHVKIRLRIVSSPHRDRLRCHPEAQAEGSRLGVPHATPKTAYSPA